MRKIVAGKLHGIHVTDSNIDYHGSITLDPDHCEQAGILPMEFVDIWNKYSGARISTYVIFGERGSRCCVLNGAAARTCQRGDPVIICNAVYVEEASIPELRPRILTFDRLNHVTEVLAYTVERDLAGHFRFEICQCADPRSSGSHPPIDSGRRNGNADSVAIVPSGVQTSPGGA